ncbi:hypothetical protein BSKO_09397 [Bryopsis sp. KO-2023]|nr:hypothetical protein BSKO_09397 [Bryopsis sp. KO-2023]
MIALRSHQALTKHKRFGQLIDSPVFKPLAPVGESHTTRSRFSRRLSRVGAVAMEKPEIVNWFPGKDVTTLYPSLKGKCVLISGGGGEGSLGLAASLQLAKLGARVYVTDYEKEISDSAVAKIREEVEGADVISTPKLDLNSMAVIREFVDWFKTKEERLDILINNTGTGYVDNEPFDTVDGIPGTSQVNFLGHYVLTRLLEDRFGSGCRIITVASVFHRKGTAVPPEILLRQWEGASYPNCKLALVMFMKLLQEKWMDKGVICMALDPGAVYTRIWDSSRITNSFPVNDIFRFFFQPPEDGIGVYLHAAASEDVAPGGYYTRGLFSTFLLTKPQGILLNIGFTIASFVDWRLRWALRGAFLADTRRVSIAPEALKHEVAQEIWDECADIAKLPK